MSCSEGRPICTKHYDCKECERVGDRLELAAYRRGRLEILKWALEQYRSPQELREAIEKEQEQSR